MYKATALLSAFFLLGAGSALGQKTDFSFNVPTSEEFTDPYPAGANSGARGVSGPYDLDGAMPLSTTGRVATNKTSS